MPYTNPANGNEKNSMAITHTMTLEIRREKNTHNGPNPYTDLRNKERKRKKTHNGQNQYNDPGNKERESEKNKKCRKQLH